MKKYYLSFCLALAACGAAYAQADTPADGAYMLYNVDHDAFLIRNGSWGTQAILGEYGQPVTIESKGDYTLLNFLDQTGVTYEPEKFWSLYINENGAVFTDRDFNNQWTIDAVDGGWALKNNSNGKYLTVNPDDAIKFPVADGEFAQAAKWQFMDGEEYEAWLEAKRVAQLNKVLQKAGISKTIDNIDDLEALFPNQIDFTAEAGLSGAGEVYQPATENNTRLDQVVPGFSCSFVAPQTGFYAISIPAMYRIANNEVTGFAANYGMDYFNATLTAGGYTDIVCGATDYMTEENINAQSSGMVLEGTRYYWPNGQDGFAAWAKEGNYNNLLFVAAQAGEKVDIKAEMRGGRVWNGQWFVYNLNYASVVLCSGQKEADLTEYNEAIADMKARLGFDKGECAPYNNVEAMKLLAEAEAADVFFDQEQADDFAAQLRAATAELEVNADDLDAVYNGDFRLCVNDAAMPGWTSTTHELGNANGAYHSRAFVYEEGDNYNVLAALQKEEGVRAAAYLRFDGMQSTQTTKYAYGADGYAYSMPLRAETEYKLSLDYGSWNSTPRDTRFYVVDAAGKTVASKITIPEDIFKGGEGTHVDVKFTPSVNGNCVLYVQNPGATNNEAFNHNIVVTNISIAKAATSGDNPGKEGIQINPADQEIIEAPAVFYDLQGVKVANPVPGRVYIEVKEGKASKVVR